MGQGGLEIRPDRSLSDDGKRLSGDGRCVFRARAFNLLKWEGGLGEGWWPIGPGADPGGFIFYVFQCLFRGSFSEGCSVVFFPVFVSLSGSRGGSFSVFF